MRSPRRTSLATLLVVATLLLGTPRTAAAISQRMTTGITLSSISGAGALVAGFGSLVYISDLEYARGWAWLSLLSGIGLGAGGLTLAIVEENSSVRRFSPVVIASGMLSLTIGMVGAILPRAGTRYHASPRQQALAPPGLPTTAVRLTLLPLVDVGTGSSAERATITGLVLGGVF